VRKGLRLSSIASETDKGLSCRAGVSR